MDIYVDLAVCDSHGQCTFAAPDVFALDDDDLLEYDAAPGDQLRAAVEQAQRSCPVQAIFLDDQARRRRP